MGRKIKLKATTLVAGTLLLFNRRASFLIAPPNFARTETLLTRTQRRDATNCKGAPGKGSHSLLFTKGSKGKGKGNEKGKGKPGKSKGLRKGKVSKGKQPNGLGRSLDDTTTSANKLGTTRHNAPSMQP